MSANTQADDIDTPKVIHFVKIKGWYIPEDAASYQLLRSLKVPLLKIHQDFIPTLQLATKAKGVRAKSKPFHEVLGDFLDRVGVVWLSKPGRRCKTTEHRSSFVCPSTPKNRKAVATLDGLCQTFFARWGFSYSPTFSETHKDLKLVMDYKFDPLRNPVILAVEPPEEPVFELILGFTKIKITFDVQRSVSPIRSRGEVRQQVASAVGAPTHILEVFARAGTEWIQVHTASFTRETVGDMNQILGCLAQLHGQSIAIKN